MEALPRHRFDEVRTALREVGINHLFARAVLEDRVAGTVRVDSLRHPQIFYIHHAYGMSLLFGDPGAVPELEVFWAELDRSSRPRQADEWLQAFPPPFSDWLCQKFGFDPQALDRRESHAQVDKETRVNFTFDREIFAEAKARMPPMGEGLELIRTDAEAFDALPGSVIPRFFWRSAAAFVRDGAGFSLRAHGEILSAAFSAFITPTELELGIETRAGHQGQGLAFRACAALIDYSLEKGLEPVWSCRQGNLGSMKLARKLGFRAIRQLPYFHFKA